MSRHVKYALNEYDNLGHTLMVFNPGDPEHDKARLRRPAVRAEIEATGDRLAETERRLAKVWEALITYGQHYGRCASANPFVGRPDRPCDCGLATALSAIEEPKP